MRIQVLFSETSVLVPCGDGQISVRELVDKAIVRFKKVLNKVTKKCSVAIACVDLFSNLC